MSTESNGQPKKKDKWDKISAITPFISTVLLAAVISGITVYYENRQTNRQAKTHELDVVVKLLPHLVGEAAQERRVAIWMIQTLGSTDLIVALRQTFPEDVASVLEQIAALPSTSDSDINLAREALEDLVTVRDGASYVYIPAGWT